MKFVYLLTLSVIVSLFFTYAPIYAQTAAEYYDMGIGKFDSADYEGAIKDFKKSIALSTNDVIKAEAYANIALIKNLQNDYRGAVVNSGKSIEIDSINVRAYVERGAANFSLGNRTEAIKDFNMAIIIDKNNTRALVGRGMAKRELGDFNGAIQDFNLAISLGSNDSRNPEIVKAYVGRGLTNFKLGSKASGCLDLSKAGELGWYQAYEYVEKFCK